MLQTSISSLCSFYSPLSLERMNWKKVLCIWVPKTCPGQTRVPIPVKSPLRCFSMSPVHMLYSATLNGGKCLAKRMKRLIRKCGKHLAAGLTPILCVGENLNVREEGKAAEWVRSQVTHALSSISREDLSRIVIAYEPIWAIGTGKTASSQDAQEMCVSIRATLNSLMGPGAEKVPILYGGSVKAENIAELLTEPDVDGALVGGASLDPLEFCETCP